MNKAAVNREVLLEFEDGKDRYVMRNPGCGSGLAVILTTSLLGKAIYGKKEGEIIEFFNSKGGLVKVKILKVFNHEMVYNTSC